MAFLEVKNITKKFGDTPVLKGISFEMEKGEVVSIIGSSGSGKTTLLRCLNFLETADSGTITVDGKTKAASDLTTREVKQIVAERKEPNCAEQRAQEYLAERKDEDERFWDLL
mgnify:CR=1 FL=1